MIEKIMKIDSLEPTNGELLEVMQKAFGYVEDRFDLMQAQMNQRFAVVDERLDSIDARLGVVERDLSRLKVSVADLQEDVTALAAAFDRDSVTLINHGERIERLEEASLVA